MGRVPIGTIGLGTSSTYPLNRIPAPPQKRTTFMHSPCISSIDGYFRNRDNQTPAPLAYVLQLFDYFVFQIPWQDQNIVRLSLANMVRMINRNARSRQEPPL